MLNRRINAIFIFIFFSTCFLGLLSYFFTQTIEFDTRENRQMAIFSYVFNPPDKDSIVYRDSCVERFEVALEDQFACRKQALDFYSIIETSIAGKINHMIYKNVDYHWYEYIGNYVRIDGTDWLTAPVSFDHVSDEQIGDHIEDIQRIHEKYPEIEIYNYFVNQAFDTDWFEQFLGAKRPDIAREIEAIIPSYIKSSQFEVGSFEDYQEKHYMTDHHWNHVGAYKGYQDIYNMMSNDMSDMGNMCIPCGTVNYSEKLNMPFYGAYARVVGELYHGKDSFSVYRYELPQRNISVIIPDSLEEIQLIEMQLWDEYDNGENIDDHTDHYQTFYGNAKDENGTLYHDSQYLFKIENTNKELAHNLLMIGDSYNRAFRDPLSTNFHTTIYLDYRVMSHTDIDRIITENDIDVMLLSGHGATWLYEESLFNFSNTTS